MECLHLSHLGFANTFSIARSQYFWEGMKADLLKFIVRCGPCIEYQNHRPFETETKKRKFDFCSDGMDWSRFVLFCGVTFPFSSQWFLTILLVP